MKIKDFLLNRGRPVITIKPDETIHSTIQILVKNNIGALPVCDNKGTVVGIISERDILKGCAGKIASIDKTRVKDIMTKDVVIGTLEDDLSYAATTMAQKGIRHLPVLDGPKLEGILSARDVVEEELKACQIEVRYLGDYISGGYV